jgi:TetR/AcrR family transcriptional regulator, transcriptional repressor for nem operon
MRYPAGQKPETRQRMLCAAARGFRSRGRDGVAISDLMRELNLTHGGFYRHFRSKEQLFAAAIGYSVEDVAGKLVRAAEGAPRGGELRTIIETYLSAWHCANLGEGCPVAALATEISRDPEASGAFDTALRGYQAALLKYLPGGSADERKRNFLVLFSGLAGALTMARATEDNELRRQILASARKFYMESFCS